MIEVSQLYPHNIIIPTYIITEDLEIVTNVFSVCACRVYVPALHKLILQLQAISRGTSKVLEHIVYTHYVSFAKLDFSFFA